MKRRERIILLAQSLGYHDNQKAFTRLCIESRIALRILRKAYRSGESLKKSGMKCICDECQPAQA